MKILLALILCFVASALCELMPPGALLTEEEARQEDKILCAITSYNSAYNISKKLKNTWGKQCDTLIFAGIVKDQHLPIEVVVSWKGTQLQKLQEIYQHVYVNYSGSATWFLIAQPDAFFMMKNVRAMLSQFNADEKLNIGQEFNRYDSNFLINTGGSIMTKNTLELLATTCSRDLSLFDDESEWLAQKFTKECLAENGVKNIDLCSYENENLMELMKSKNLTQTEGSNCIQAIASFSTVYNHPEQFAAFF